MQSIVLGSWMGASLGKWTKLSAPLELTAPGTLSRAREGETAAPQRHGREVRRSQVDKGHREEVGRASESWAGGAA